MSITARQHTVIALLLFCALAAALNLSGNGISYAEMSAIETRYEMYPPLPRAVYSAITRNYTVSTLQLRFISIAFSGLGLFFSWLLARRVASPSLALAVPAALAGTSFWNMAARSATPDMMMLATIVAVFWLVLPSPSNSANKSLQQRGLFILRLLSAVILASVTLPFRGSGALSDIFREASAADIYSALPFVACIPFTVWFAVATRENAKSASKNRNALIMLATAVVFAVQSLTVRDNIGIFCLPFAVISGIRIIEAAFSPEVSPRVGAIAVALPYSLAIATVIASLFPIAEIMLGIGGIALALWGVVVLAAFLAPREIIRQWLAHAVIAVGVVVPLLLMLRIMAGNIGNTSRNSVAEPKPSTFSIH
ncbi:hypothetical protein MASR2M18_11680 [Ignavibacteria bacterium]|nr:glycosyltransferase family 39 protein [Bacteroidota bacterium]MCZ2132371.1 glycosyltransferase family 39 protein [Bacteroidota bacterium]